MTMEELVKRMDESFIELRKLHDSEKVEHVMVETIASLLHKIDERDETIARLRLEIQQLKEEQDRAIKYS